MKKSYRLVSISSMVIYASTSYSQGWQSSTYYTKLQNDQHLVGIGAIPDYKLHVKTNGDVKGVVESTTNNSAAIQVKLPSIGYEWQVFGENLRLNQIGNTIVPNIITITKAFTSSSRVGIGVDNPSATLDVNGNMKSKGLEARIITPTSHTLTRVAISGVSVQYENSGIGVEGSGGMVGVRGYANVINPSRSNYGVWGIAGNGLYNYGVMGEAPMSAGSWAGYFQGNVYATGSFTSASDRKLKSDIRPLENNLVNVLKLSPSSYYWKADSSKNKKHNFGLIAQEVEKVYPELVSEVTVPVNSDDIHANKIQKPEVIKSVDYVSLIPVLIGAIQEQQIQIEELKRKLR